MLKVYQSVYIPLHSNHQWLCFVFVGTIIIIIDINVFGYNVCHSTIPMLCAIIDSFMMTKLHKDIAMHMMQCVQSEDHADSATIKVSHSSSYTCTHTCTH